MTYEFDKFTREFEKKLDKYNQHIEWLAGETKKIQEALTPKLQESPENVISTQATPTPTPNIKELTNEEFSQRHTKHGQKFLDERINELANLYPEKSSLDIDPQREEMLKAIRAGTPISKLISQFSK